MHEFILRNWRIVKVATTKAQRKLFFNLRKNKKRLGWMTAAERSAVAKDLNVSEREVLEMESRLSGRDIGFDAPADSGDDDHAPPAPISYLVDHHDDPALAYERESHEDSQLELLRDGLSDLDPRSRDILKRRFLGEPKATLQELADEYGVSAERVRQIEANALKKMRALFAA
jgi:RNA polymerase sigma-32 factor